MADLEHQLRGYAGRLDLGPTIDPAEITAASPPERRSPVGGWLFAAAAAVLVVVVLGAAVIALRDDGTEEPAPSVDTRVGPQGWERLGEIDGAQPFAMAASDRGVVLVGSGTWWSEDGSRWEAGFVTDLVTATPVRPDLMHDVIATDDGFLAVGTGYDRQPTVWRSTDGRSWDRVVDDQLQVPPRSIPPEMSAAYGTIEAVVATDDGFVAVGSVFDGTFVGETMTSPEPFRPAVWTSGDGVDWARVDYLPGGVEGQGARGTLVDAVARSGDVVAVGTDGDQTFVWELQLTGWNWIGSFTGTATSVSRVDDRLVATGWRAEATTQIATIWSSTEGRGTWAVVHEEPPSNLGTLTDLVPDGDLLLALGYTGSLELQTEPLVFSSSDGTGWSPLSTIEAGEEGCPAAPSATPGCPMIGAYPVGATVDDGDLLLAVVESVTDRSSTGNRNVTRIGTAVYRAVDDDPPEDESGTSGGSTPLRARLELPSTALDAGSRMEGKVVVQNDTGGAIEATRCGNLYSALLHGNSYVQESAELLCGGTRFVVPVGESPWPVTIAGLQTSCVSGTPTDGQPACLPDGGPPPLPAGEYEVVVTAPGGIPRPDPVTVTVR